MRRSTDRILTTHVGALPAPHDVWARLDVTDERLAEAVAEVCDRQRSAGIDFINEGELTKGGHWAEYLAARLGGYEPAGHPGALRASCCCRAPTGSSSATSTSPCWQNGTLFEQSGAAQHVPEGAEATTQAVEDWVAAEPVHYRGQAALEREIDVMKGALGDTPASDAFLTTTAPLSVEPGSRQGHVRDRRGAHLRHRRGDAGRVRGDRRRRVPGAGRRRVARRAVGPHRHPDGARRLPQVLPDALRGAEPRAAEHPRGADPLPPVLGELARTALRRPAVARRRRHHAVDQGPDLLDRGRQRPPRARGGALGRRPSCPTARCSRPVSSPTRRR